MIGEASICTKGLAKLPNGVEVWGVSGARIAKKLVGNEMVRRCETYPTVSLHLVGIVLHFLVSFDHTVTLQKIS